MRQLRALAYISLVYGGFLIITYAVFGYSAVWRQEFLPIFPEGPSRFPSDNLSGIPRIIGEPRIVREPMSLVLSPQALGLLLTGILFVVNGYYLLKFLNQKDRAETKKFVISSMLTEEERQVFDELVKSGGQATQKQLASAMGFSAVKTYRVLKRLESKKVVKTFPFGMTKKIVLEEK